MNRAISAVHDQRRDLIFKIGDRIHWFEYSADTVIMGGGYGIIIEIEKRFESDGALPFLKVMKDGTCVIQEFPIQDCDLEGEWED